MKNNILNLQEFRVDLSQPPLTKTQLAELEQKKHDEINRVEAKKRGVKRLHAIVHVASLLLIAWAIFYLSPKDELNKVVLYSSLGFYFVVAHIMVLMTLLQAQLIHWDARKGMINNNWDGLKELNESVDQLQLHMLFERYIHHPKVRFYLEKLDRAPIWQEYYEASLLYSSVLRKAG